MGSWIEALWFFLPAGIANMSPVLANKIPILKRWKTPIDGGRSYRGIRLLGNNKTWRGLVFGVAAALLINEIQMMFFTWHITPVWFVAGLMGFGALFGDLFESFIKRQKRIPSGESWFPFDQIDYIIGGLLFVWPFANLSIMVVLQIIVLYFGLHLVTAYIGYLLGLKDKPI